MSNADDRCAREGCGKERREHQHGGSAAGCRFVESREDALARRARYQVSVRLATLRASAAQPAPSGDACHCGHPFTARCKSTAPSGDEAKVREIARAEAESIATRWVPAHMTARQGMVDDITASLIRCRALGRYDARRGSEGK